MSRKQGLGLYNLLKTTSKSKKRVGRGYGSGKGGHTSGRGQKGQRSRRTTPWWFEGGQLPLVRRVPFLRGKGRLNPLKQKPVIIKTDQFNKLKSGSLVTIDTLIQERMVSEADIKSRGVKILAGGKLEKKLTVIGLTLSAGAGKEIESKGGKIEVEKRDREERAEKKPIVKKTSVKKITKPKTGKKNLKV